MGKKKICWITGDAFMDTDQNVVPYLMKYSGMQIDWYQLSDFNSKVPAHPDVTCVFKFKNRGLNPLRILEYIKLESMTLYIRVLLMCPISFLFLNSLQERFS